MSGYKNLSFSIILTIVFLLGALIAAFYLDKYWLSTPQLIQIRIESAILEGQQTVYDWQTIQIENRTTEHFHYEARIPGEKICTEGTLAPGEHITILPGCTHILWWIELDRGPDGIAYSSKPPKL